MKARLDVKGKNLEVDFSKGKDISISLLVELPMGRSGTTFGLDYSYRHTDPFQGSHSIGARINL